MTGQKLPTFIVGGAVKGATTWIAHQLRTHPSVFLPGPEPHYFSSAYDRGLDWYAGLFADAEADEVIGEKSADYLAYEAAPGRIASVLPEVRLVMQLRNPVERAYSDYCMLFRRGTVNADIAHHLSRASEQPRFLNDGLYRRHLGRWLEHFPAEQLKVILHDDIKQRAETTIAAVCEHVGVPVRIDRSQVGARKNDSEALFLPLSVRLGLAPIKQLVAPLRRQSWFKRVHGALARPVPYPPLTPELRQRLCDYYAADVAQLGNLLGRDLSHWLQPAESLATAA